METLTPPTDEQITAVTEWMKMQMVMVQQAVAQRMAGNVDAVRELVAQAAPTRVTMQPVAATLSSRQAMLMRRYLGVHGPVTTETINTRPDDPMPAAEFEAAEACAAILGATLNDDIAGAGLLWDQLDDEVAFEVLCVMVSAVASVQCVIMGTRLPGT